MPLLIRLGFVSRKYWLLTSILFALTFSSSFSQSVESSGDNGQVIPPRIIVSDGPDAHAKLKQHINGNLVSGTKILNFTGSSEILWKPYNVLQLTCSSTYKTKWDSNIGFKTISNFSASQMETNSEEKVAPLGSQAQRKFTSTISFTIMHSRGGFITCMSIADQSVNSSLYIYLEADSSGDLIHGNDFAITTNISHPESSILVPCRTRNPSKIAPTIERENSENNQFVAVDKSDIMAYDHKIGFTLKRPSTGDFPSTYECIFGKTRMQISTVAIEKMPQPDPQPLKFEFVSDTRANLKCLPKTPENLGFLKNVSENRTIRLLQCQNPYECQLRTTQVSGISGDNVAKDCKQNVECVGELKAFSSGVAMCNVGPFKVTEIFFTGLASQTRYLLSQDFPDSAAILMDDPKKTYLTTELAIFKCSALKFLLDPEITFYIKKNNGKMVKIEDIDLSADSKPEFSSPPISSGNDDQKVFVRRVSLKLTEDVSEIICTAPWFNSSSNDRPKASQQVKVRVPEGAFVEKESSSKNTTFSPGDANKNLVCVGGGYPTPAVTWEFANMENNSNFKTVTNDGRCTLEFLKVEFSHEGIYKCHVQNDFGNDTLEFHVHVKGIFGVEEIATIAVVGTVVLLLLGVAITLGVKYYHAKQKIRNLTEEEVQNFILGSASTGSQRNTYVTIGSTGKEVVGAEKALQRPFTREITDSDLFVDHNKVLGKGEYGFVYSGFFLGEAVAIKTCKPSTEIAHVKALLDEIKIMEYIGNHPHIINFLGAEVKKIRQKKIHVVVELSPLGSLQEYLRTYSREFIDLIHPSNGCMRKIDVESDLSTLTMLNWCAQIADGMIFLEEKKVIHGDLAARNVLVFSNNILKITDFGLSRQLYNYMTYTKKQKAPLPWRWMAIESLRFMEFSSQSDVWAYGMTAWEIFSLAQLPYSAYTWDLDFMDKIERGMRVGQPHMAPKGVYDTLLKCWLNNPSARPSFQYLKHFFLEQHQFIKEQADYHGTNESLNSITGKKSVTFE